MYKYAAIGAFLRKMHDANILYCHWKSNEHVREGLAGKTDLDILVNRDSRLEVERILAGEGFKRFSAVRVRRYPGIEDYLGLDRTSGQLIHLHLHWQLTLGEKFLKGYHLSWERIVLSTRRFDSEHSIYVADATIEMLLLIIRMTLKIRLRDRFFASLGRVYWGDTELREHAWLQEKLDEQKLREYAQKLLDPQSAELISRIAGGETNMTTLLTLRKSMHVLMRQYRRYGSVLARLLRWHRELLCDIGVVNERFFHFPIPSRRICPTGGILVALVGCDGAGKSAVANEIVKWLQHKLDVMLIYFGSGDGHSSFVRYPLVVLHRILRRILSSTAGHNDSTSRASQFRPLFARMFSGLKGFARIPWALVLAYEKRGNLYKARRARDRGMVVICDRYPQSQIPGFNDGPLLAHWSNHRFWVLRTLSNWERSVYEQAEKNPPDLVIKLQVKPKIALTRKPETGEDEVLRRVKAISDLHYQPPARMVTVDANAPLDKVVLKVKQLIWECI